MFVIERTINYNVELRSLINLITNKHLLNWQTNTSRNNGNMVFIFLIFNGISKGSVISLFILRTNHFKVKIFLF